MPRTSPHPSAAAVGTLEGFTGGRVTPLTCSLTDPGVRSARSWLCSPGGTWYLVPTGKLGAAAASHGEPWPGPHTLQWVGISFPKAPADLAEEYLQACFVDQGDWGLVECSGLQERWAGKPTLSPQPRAPMVRRGNGHGQGTCRTSGLCGLAVHMLRSAHTSSCVSVNPNSAFLLPLPAETRNFPSKGHRSTQSLEGPSREPTQLSGCSCAH